MKARSLVWLCAAGLLFLVLICFSLRFFWPSNSPAKTIGAIFASSTGQTLIGAQYTDISAFLTPIKQAKTTLATGTVTGLIVPHHLLAKDLAAKAFATAASGQYQTIVLLSPDHFLAGRTAISTTARNFSTVFGPVQTATDIARQLKTLPFVGEGDFFYREHGLQAELPFVKYYFPKAKVVAVTFQPSVTKDELDQVVAVLEKNLPTASLVVQSTDFSHYLTPQQAAVRDQETLDTLEQSDPTKILSLNQPDNIDSLAAQYVQARLQQDFFHSHLNILAHKNSQAYTTSPVASSTSYFAATYVRPTVPNAISQATASSTEEKGSVKLIFVGDVMLSRYIGKLMAARQDYDFPFVLIKSFLAQADLVFGNLESPISDSGADAGHLYSFRAASSSAPGLREAGFKVLSVANNHAFDYGLAAFSDTLANLKKVGLAYAGGGQNYAEAHHGSDQEINGVKISFLAYTDLLPASEAASNQRAGFAYLDEDQMSKDIKAAKARSDLVIVSFHWGREYETKHNTKQAEIAAAAIKAGASLVVGHHPHAVQEVQTMDGVTVAYSLGNFVFDQNFSPETSTGLALKVLVKDKKIVSVEPQTIRFNHYFQPYLVK
jgi:poly-gamma-glutamate synthesis protein (capsule biosynthesis protein)